ncbi:hypothetical protein GPECTOR_68g360 [Gonium pectorale]|uniref:Uncharacterized protein n=1 Tax=Gonium pectorale TaxID=33097 RepID=A0A150G3D4_GONPE|nr:hypothetical protein GPECTOR_68g360 [Gonium pectorale]|eukprot:KXZ44389.1 hypothetical protein GPECTOR_68g360 [Gonium pectorale]
MSESVISDFGSEENVDLKRNFENNNVEKQYQSLCESWRVELEEKQRHLEAAKAQILGPRDLDVLRVKLLEEVDAPYKAKIDNLSREAESSHQAYLKLRQDYEELQQTYRSLEVRTVGDQEAHRLETTALTRELREKTANLTAAQGEWPGPVPNRQRGGGGLESKLATCEAALRSLQRDMEAAKYASNQMKAELDEVRRAKERAVVERESAAVQAEKKVKAAEEETAQLMSFVESVGRKNRHLVQELAESQRAAEDLFAANVRLQSAQTQLQAQLDSAVRLASGEKAAILAEQEEAVRRLEERLVSAQGEVAKREGALAELKLAQQEELAKLSASCEARINEERRAAAERVRELLDAKADAMERATAAQRLADEKRRELEAALRQVQSEADSASREAGAESLRADGLAKQLAEATAGADAIRTELADVKVLPGGFVRGADMVRLQMNCQQLTEKRVELEQRLAAAEEGAVQARAARDALAAEVDAVRREAEEQQRAAARSAESTRAAWALEKAALAKRYQAAIKELTSRHEGELRKVKRKARGAHAAVAQLTDEVADLKFKAAEVRHVNHMSDGLLLTGPGRPGSPYRDHTYSPTPGSTPGAGAYYGSSGGGAYSPRPLSAPSYLAPSAPNVVIVTGNGGGGGSANNGIAAAAAAGAAAGAAAQAQAQSLAFEGGGSGGEGHGHGGGADGGGGALVDSALLSSIAALRNRQLQYMDAARRSLQS